MAKVIIEPWTPAHRSLCWRLADAYFAGRGIDAWTKGEIPHDATDNYGMARQHARFLAEHAAATAPAPAEVWVLEVGSGLGQFAANLVRALEADAGEAGRALVPRLKIVLTDYAAKTVEQAAASPNLAPLVARGTVIPALLDMRHPARLVDLEGAPLSPPPLTAVYANYVCCVLPPRNLQRRKDRWFEQLVQMSAEVDGEVPPPAADARELLSDPTRESLLDELTLLWGWQPVDLADALPPGLHAEVLEATAEALPEATISYPAPFIDFLLAFAPRLSPDGVFVVSDYGRVERDMLAGLNDRKPQIYGNSLAFEVHFPVFDAFADAAGWSVLRTDDRNRSLHTALLRPGGAFRGDEAARFDDSYRHAHEGEDLVDFYDIAMRAADDEEFDRAVRFYRRCVHLDPQSAQYRYKLADALADSGDHARALAEALRSRDLPGAEEHDFDFLLGRIHALLENYGAATAWYERSLQREEHQVTLTNLGTLYEHDRRWDDARAAYRRALELQPDYQRAIDNLASLDDDEP